MKYMLRELFFFHSGSGALTEHTIYENQPIPNEARVLVMSSATDDSTRLPACTANFVRERGLNIFEPGKEYILVARNGQAGSMRLMSGQQFTITDHAYVLEPKKKAAGIIDLNFFVLAFQDLFFDLVTTKDANGTFPKNIAEKMIISIPSIETQLQIKIIYSKYGHARRKIITMLERVKKTSQKSAVTLHEKSVLIKNLFKVTSGLRVTQKEVYEKSGDFPIVTAKTENNGIAWHANKEWLSSITKNGSKTLVERDCITWCKNGVNAGRLFLRREPFYPGDDCGVLKPIKPVILEWFYWTAQQDVYVNTTSKGGQGKLFDRQMSNIPIAVPINPATGDIDFIAQQKVASEYERLQSVESRLIRLIGGTESAMQRLQQVAISLTAPE